MALRVLILSFTMLSWATAAHPGSYAEVGLPFLTNFSPKEYGAGQSNWAIVQDNRGVMYFGNENGLLEYDGASWRLIHLPNRSGVRALALDSNGRIYVGGTGDLGYLAADSMGQMRFVSLLPQVPESNRDFGDAWLTHATGDGVYFLTDQNIFRWANGRMKTWSAATRFHVAAVVNGSYYVRQWEVGLTRMEGDSLRLVPGGEQFAHERIYVMLPFDEHRMLIGTRTRGLFLYDGARFRPFKTEADDYLLTNQLYLPGAVLSDGTFALGTYTGGVVIIDRQGRQIHRIDKNAGLRDDATVYVYADRSDGLWLALYNGIARLETPSPLTVHDERSGLQFPIFDMARHEGILYVASNLGTFWLDAASGNFRPVAGTTGQCFDLLSVGHDLLLADIDAGLLRIERGRARPVRRSENYDFRVNFLHSWRKHPRYLFAALENGLAILRLRRGRWIDQGRVGGIQENIVFIAESNDGTLWLGTQNDGCLRVSFPDGAADDSPLSNPEIVRFSDADGLPVGGVSVFKAGDGMYYFTEDGPFRYQQSSGSFLPDSTFADVSFDASSLNLVVVEDRNQGIWLNLGAETSVARRQADGSYQVHKTPFLRFSDSPALAIYPEENGVVWFGGADALIRYDAAVPKKYARDYSALIRRVIVGEDSVVFGGASGKCPFDRIQPSKGLEYAANTLRFEFAAPFHDRPRDTRFQSMLEGFDDHWSAWGNEHFRSYTNLPHGRYRFRVRAMNIYNQLSGEAVYQFRIEAPWYRTPWAYGGYALALAAFMFLVDRVQRRRLIAKERERARLREAELRAEAAETLAKSQTERTRNIELLSAIGRDITATLSIQTIIETVYENVNALMDASVFGIGLFDAEQQGIEMQAIREKGKTRPPLTYSIHDKNSLAVWCFVNQEEVFINDGVSGWSKYVKKWHGSAAGDAPQSMLYLPLTFKDKRIGIITAQSFSRDAYTEYHLNILHNLATHAAIALDNADAYKSLNQTLEHLKATQDQLVTQEKLASLGVLTAGIAHEIRNPLNFVNNFAELSIELVEELREDLREIKTRLDPETASDVEDIMTDLAENARKIDEHGKRAESIVKSMLQHSRENKGERQDTDINAMLKEDLNLAYHGMRAQHANFNVSIETDFDQSVATLSLVPQDISRVFLNIITNGLYAAHQRKASDGGDFSPTLYVRTLDAEDRIEVRIRDNGTGIPEEFREKLFQPFFTTKPAGSGTGLGLSISYDIIVKQHRGDITFETEEGEFTEFVISLPKSGK